MAFLRRKENKTPDRRDLPVLEADPAQGLTAAQAAARAEAGWGNVEVAPPIRTAGQIVRSNLLTYFNLIFALLAAALITVRASATLPIPDGEESVLDLSGAKLYFDEGDADSATIVVPLEGDTPSRFFRIEGRLT